MALFISLWVKLFFIFTPFFALTMFLALTEQHTNTERQRIALFAALSVALVSLVLFFAGNQLFAIFGITVDSFRVGAGILLLLSAISLVQGQPKTASDAQGTITVVPLAIPIIVGPAATGTLLVLGAELNTPMTQIIGCLALLCAVVSVGGVLLAGSLIERIVGTIGIAILSKITGLILAALAAQMILTGVRGFLGL